VVLVVEVVCGVRRNKTSKEEEGRGAEGRRELAERASIIGILIDQNPPIAAKKQGIQTLKDVLYAL
jgi:hypothetical protein